MSWRDSGVETHQDSPMCVGQWCCGCAEHPVGKPWGWNYQAWDSHIGEAHPDGVLLGAENRDGAAA